MYRNTILSIFVALIAGYALFVVGFAEKEHNLILYVGKGLQAAVDDIVIATTGTVTITAYELIVNTVQPFEVDAADIDFASTGSFRIYSGTTMIIEAEDKMYINANNGLCISVSGQDLDINVQDCMDIDAVGCVDINSGTTMTLHADGKMILDANAGLCFDVTGDLDLNLSGCFNVDAQCITLEALTTIGITATTDLTLAAENDTVIQTGNDLSVITDNLTDISSGNNMTVSVTGTYDTQTTGDITIDSSGGAISIGSDTDSGTINIGNTSDRIINIGFNSSKINLSKPMHVNSFTTKTDQFF